MSRAAHKSKVLAYDEELRACAVLEESDYEERKPGVLDFANEIGWNPAGQGDVYH